MIEPWDSDAYRDEAGGMPNLKPVDQLRREDGSEAGL